MRWGEVVGTNPDNSLIRHTWEDGTLWGASYTPPRELTWVIEVDWDGDGAFSGENEFPYTFDLFTKRGRTFYMNASGSGFQPVEIGEATIQLVNDFGRFDPYNASGPLYGMLLPGRRIRIRVMRESDGAIKNVFFGRVLDVRPSYGTDNTATITAQDDIAFLVASTVKTTLYSMCRYNTAIENILAAINWQKGTSIDSVVSDTMAYWWASGGSALDEITDLVDSALGLFFVAADGTAKYYDRLDSPDAVLSLTDSDWTQEYGVKSPMPWEIVKNLIRIYARARLSVAAVEIWKMIDTPTIAAGASIEVWATFNYNGEDVPATSVTTPVVTTDYTASVSAADISITMTTYAMSAKLVIKNNNASSQVLTLMRLRGTVITPDQYTFTEKSDAASITTYGERDFIVQTNWLQDINAAIEHASILLNRLSSPKQFPRLALVANLSKQFEIDLFDIANLNLASRDITGNLRVGYIEHRSISRNLQIFSTVLYFEPNTASATSGTWIFPATFGLTTVF